jgi:beta-mannosidase
LGPGVILKQSPLASTWKLQHFHDSAGEPAGAYLPDHDDSGWFPATVPGQVHLDLMAAGVIPDPFFGLSYERCLWVEEKEWWYRTTFVPQRDELLGKRVELVFEGLDTFATVFLNGEEVATSCNMWVPLVIDVTDRLKWGEANLLAVRLRSPFEAVKPDMEADDTADVNAFFSPKERLYARKAQMSYGWDIAPRIVSVGIWRPVYLCAVPEVVVRGFWQWTRRLSEGEAELVFEVEVENLADEPRTVTIRMAAACEGHEILWECQKDLVPGSSTVVVGKRVEAPRLWWPHRMGEQSLYRGTVSVGSIEQMLHVKHCTFGIRTLDLVLKDPETGENRFYFTVNGVPCFMRGTNWMPTDAIFARVTPARLRAVLDLCRDAHCNMVRIWGGGIYEDPAFYDLCDEMGILVWQDFMMACGLYPQNEGFLRQMREEAEWVVRELRGHPCLALWAGDNENDCAYGWGEGEAEGYLQNRLTREVLPEVCARLDPSRTYIPSSPFDPSGHGNPNAPEEGDVHLWDHSVRARHPMYFTDTSKFLSEIGRICAANLSSTQRFLAPEDQWPVANKAWEHHVGTIPTSDFQRRWKTDEGIRNLIGRDAESLEEYIAASQYGQAWCLGEWIERARRRKFECGGILWWNIFDNWPEHVDAVVDYYFGKKVGYTAVCRASRLLMPSIAREGDLFRTYLLNDTLEPSSGMLTVSVCDLAGNAWVAQAGYVTISPNTSAAVAEIPADDLGELDADQHYLHVTYQPDGAEAIENWHILGDVKSLAVFEAVYGPVSE